MKEFNTTQEISTTGFQEFVTFTLEVMNGEITASVALEKLICRTKTLKLYGSFRSEGLILEPSSTSMMELFCKYT